MTKVKCTPDIELTENDPISQTPGLDMAYLYQYFRENQHCFIGDGQYTAEHDGGR